MFRIFGVSFSRTFLSVLCLGALLCLTGNYLINRGLFLHPWASVALHTKDTRETYGRARWTNSSDSMHRSKETSRGDAEETNQQSSDVFVIIVSQWRFGSSIIGELFNQNPNIFYVYEPLWVFTDEAKRLHHELTHYDYQVSPKDNYRRVLRGMPRCDFSEDFVRVMNTYGGKSRSKLICESTVDVGNCNISSADWLSSVCKRSGGRVATKLIRVDLDTIKPLIIDDHINVKVINVVRDPRGAASSRVHYDLVLNPRDIDLVALSDQIPKQGRLAPLKFLTNKRPGTQSLPAMCDSMKANFQKASHLPSWLQHRYKLVRFEDFAEDPVKVAREIYDFIGIPLPPTVSEWMADHTAASHDQVEESGLFGTRKNAKDVAKQWMTDLTELEIRQVEDICKEPMKLLGYKAFDELKKSRDGFTLT